MPFKVGLKGFFYGLCQPLFPAVFIEITQVLNKVLGVKYMYNESIDVVDNPVTGIREINIHARPYSRLMDTCPYCMNNEKPCKKMRRRYA
jgi:hypothetical protein